MIAQIAKFTACIAVACALSGPALAADGVQMAALDSNGASIGSAAASAQDNVATHAPQRLSPLSGSDDAAWADAHSLRAVSWHRTRAPLRATPAKVVTVNKVATGKPASGKSASAAVGSRFASR